MRSHNDQRRPFTAIVKTSRRSAVLGVVLVAGVVSVAVLGAQSASAVATKPNLGTAGAYSVLAASAVTNTGPSVLSDSLGVSPKEAISGFPPGLVGGQTHAGDAAAAEAQSDLGIAYESAAGQASDGDVGGELGGQTFKPGVYTASSSVGLTGPVTLDAEGDPGAVFIFQIGTTLTTATASSVVPINGAQACNVFWQVGSSATLGTSTVFVGNIMALVSIGTQSGTTIDGRALARTGAVTLINTVFTRSDCDTTTPTSNPPVTNPPVTNPPVTNPPVTNPPVTNPPVTNPPVTNPPVTNPPVTNPPVTNPPVTNPPVTNPPVTNPPVTNPPVTNPPVTNPPVTNPPVTNPPVTNPPVTNPPVTNPPVTNPPVTNPPVTNPPDTNPPVTNPPVTNPPVTNPPVTNPPATNPPVTNPPVTSPPESNTPVVPVPPLPSNTASATPVAPSGPSGPDDSAGGGSLALTGAGSLPVMVAVSAGVVLVLGAGILVVAATLRRRRSA
jgi:hypothetical protein